METKKPKLKDEEIDKRVEALASMMQHWGWKPYADTVQFLQGIYSSKLFEKKFAKLDPVQKDKEHYAIVEVINVLDLLLKLPQWLEKRRPKHWNDIINQFREELQHGRE